jgi:hydroxyacylglutathione hydrolase
MELVQLPAFSDNYLWLLVEGSQAVAVDPGDAGPVERELAARGLALAAIWCTHHHPDHVGGVARLAARWPGVPVLGSRRDADEGRIPALTRAVADGDAVQFGGHVGRVMFLPGHTRGLCGYIIDGMLFAGDALFGFGCGRLFEGTPAMMQASLARIRLLPDATRVCAAHEYTRLNVGWAQAVEPGNTALQARAQRLAALPADARTVPLELGEEKATNPMLRWDAPELRARFGTTDDVSTFAACRADRDAWRR